MANESRSWGEYSESKALATIIAERAAVAGGALLAPVAHASEQLRATAYARWEVLSYLDCAIFDLLLRGGASTDPTTDRVWVDHPATKQVVKALTTAQIEFTGWLQSSEFIERFSESVADKQARLATVQEVQQIVDDLSKGKTPRAATPAATQEDHQNATPAWEHLLD